MSEDVPKQIAVLDDTIAEEWVRRTSEPDIRGVGASKWREQTPWGWRVTIWAAEHLRDGALEGKMRARIDAALRAVPSVTDVAEADREVWDVAGEPNGEALVRAAAEVVDQLGDRIRAHVRSRGDAS